jgi:peptide/nickel transport system substrate-binding protein
MRKLGRIRSWTVIIMAGTLASALSACSGSAAGGSSGGSGGELRVGIHLSIDSMNPFVAVQTSSIAVFEYIYPALVQYNTDLKIVPDFATSWSVTPNGLTWTFHTHPGAKWSDGHPLTASDAAWTINTTLKYATGGAAEFAGYVAGVKSATAANANTLVIHMTSPQAAFLANIRQMPILPEHIWSRYAAGTNGANLRTFSNQPSPGHPVASGGPFICTEYQQLGVSLFTRNPDYFGPKPEISGFGLEYFTSPDAELLALRHGQVDAVWDLPPSGARSLESDHQIVVHSQLGLNDHDFIFNDYSKQTADPELTLPIVHLAFDYAINRPEIVKDAFDGFAQPASSPVLAATGVWHDPAIKPPPFNLAKANQLLNKAGFKMGPNGIRIADGHPMSYQVVLAADELGAGSAAYQIMQADFAKIGVQLTLDSVDDATAAALEVAPSTKFHIGMWGWTPPPDPNFMLNTYTCSQWGGWSETGLCNSTYDSLYDQQASEINPTKRLQIVYQMERYLQQELPEIIYVDADWLDAWSNNWTGFGETAQGFFTPLTTMGLLHVHTDSAGS